MGEIIYEASKAGEAGLRTEEALTRSSSSSLSDQRAAFLSTFSAEEDRRIMRKVDKRFLLLIGLMYMLKNVDYTNAATVKVLQVGEPRNVLTELNMTPDEYNWVQSIYFVSVIGGEFPVVGRVPNCVELDQLYRLRSP